MIHLKTERACGRCPMAMLCVARKKLPHAVFCRRCGCVTFKHDNERFLCSQIREGIHSRITNHKDVMGWDHMSDRDKRVAHVLQAVLSTNAEYEGCVRTKPHLVTRTPRRRWHDCIDFFRQTNGFDIEI